MTFLVHVKDRAAFLTVRSATDFSAKVGIADVEDAFADVIIECTHGYRHAVPVFTIGDRKRYASLDQRDHCVRDIPELLSGQ